MSLDEIRGSSHPLHVSYARNERFGPICLTLHGPLLRRCRILEFITGCPKPYISNESLQCRGPCLDSNILAVVLCFAAEICVNQSSNSHLHRPSFSCTGWSTKKGRVRARCKGSRSFQLMHVIQKAPKEVSRLLCLTRFSPNSGRLVPRCCLSDQRFGKSSRCTACLGSHGGDLS